MATAGRDRPGQYRLRPIDTLISLTRNVLTRFLESPLRWRPATNGIDSNLRLAPEIGGGTAKNPDEASRGGGCPTDSSSPGRRSALPCKRSEPAPAPAHDRRALRSQPSHDLLRAKILTKQSLQRSVMFGLVPAIASCPPTPAAGLLHRKHRPIGTVVARSVSTDLAINRTPVPPKRSRNLHNLVPLDSH